MTQSPVVVMIFNRPEKTRSVLEQIARACPGKLLVIADGPRDGHAEDAEKCAAARAAVERFDWQCEVLKNYSDVNVGVGIRPATGLQWAFENVEEAIVLEDDCLPHPSFFRFCEEMLEKYRHDERIMHISGDNWHFANKPGPDSYFFSCYPYSCGWATWRRAFQYYDPNLRLWPALREGPWLADVLGDESSVDFWKEKFDAIVDGGGIQVHGWDWPWLFACLAHRGLAVIPAVNLISNIGFDHEGTHTTEVNDQRARLSTVEMKFPLRHPVCMARDPIVDRSIAETVGLEPIREDRYRKLRRGYHALFPASIRKSISPVLLKCARRYNRVKARLL